LLFKIESNKFKTYIVIADNISQAKYIYSEILSNKYNVSFDDVYNSIIKSYEVSTMTIGDILNKG